ncbi:uncharacterized protein [Halyomorpha halys]|uniref:uncharacterized protein n=1 Tax=Halyomorpha halys TaxID=286706 RepID=UPI0034D32556
MGDLEGTLKELPKNIKEGKVKKTKALDHKLAEKVDIKAGEVMKRMQEMAPPRLKFGWEGYSTDEDEEGIGDWINHEGFNNKEDLERYNEIFKEFVGEYPNEYERRNVEEGYYDKDGMGRAIDRTKAGRQRRRGLYSPRNNDLAETEALTKCKEMEKNLRDVLSRAKNTNGDPEVGSVISERRFLDTYMEKKMETVHTTDGSQNNDTTDKKKYNIRKIPTKKKTEDEEKKICIDGPVRRGTPADDGDTSSPARSSRKSVMIPVTSSSKLWMEADPLGCRLEADPLDCRLEADPPGCEMETDPPGCRLEAGPPGSGWMLFIQAVRWRLILEVKIKFDRMIWCTVLEFSYQYCDLIIVLLSQQ